jgi:hypothetical protein
MSADFSGGEATERVADVSVQHPDFPHRGPSQMPVPSPEHREAERRAYRERAPLAYGPPLPKEQLKPEIRRGLETQPGIFGNPWGDEDR